MGTSLQHSAEVDIYLLIDGNRYEVAGCLGNKCTLRNPVNLPPCSAELVIVIDGMERRRQVYLKDGVSLNSPEIEVETL